MDELIKRLRESMRAGDLTDEAADALEAQQARIAELRKALEIVKPGQLITWRADDIFEKVLSRTDDLSALAAHDAEVRKAALLEAAADAEQHIDCPIDKEDEEINGHLVFMVKHLRRMAEGGTK